MLALYDALVSYFDAHPRQGLVASAGIGGLHFIGRLAISSAHLIAQTPPVTPTIMVWAGYVTVIATAGGAVFALLIQGTRLYRTFTGGDSRPPFEKPKRKQRHHHEHL